MPCLICFQPRSVLIRSQIRANFSSRSYPTRSARYEEVSYAVDARGIEGSVGRVGSFVRTSLLSPDCVFGCLSGNGNWGERLLLLDEREDVDWVEQEGDGRATT